MKSKIRDELVGLTGIAAQKKNETDERFRARLVRAADTIDDKDWDKLSESAQEWVNGGIDALEEKSDVADFPDAEAEVNDAGTKKKDKSPAVPKAPKRGASSHAMRLAIIQNPDAKIAELLAICEEGGFILSKSSAEVIYYETRGTIRALEELKLLKGTK